MYKIQFAPLNLCQYRSLDEILHKAYRSITNNMPTFPRALLEIAPANGGLGLSSLSASAQLTKWRMAIRQLLSRDSAATDSLLLRPLRQCHIVPTLGFSYRLTLHLIPERTTFLTAELPA
jgi:hypothetical protein